MWSLPWINILNPCITESYIAEVLNLFDIKQLEEYSAYITEVPNFLDKKQLEEYYTYISEVLNFLDIKQPEEYYAYIADVLNFLDITSWRSIIPTLLKSLTCLI